MINQLSNTFLSRLWQYQKERFPLVIIIFTSLAVTLSTYAVSEGETSMHIAAYLTTIFYMAHIRILDEFKDFQHDLEFYPERPLPRGLVSKRELWGLFFVLGVTEITLNVFLNTPTGFIFFLLAFSYTMLAGKEFFLRDWLRPHLLLYNAIHYFQLILLQLYLYATYWPMRKDLLIAHLGLSVLATLLIELARKMRPRGQDTAQDTYSWRLGIGGANAIYIFITVATAVFATRILAITGKLLLYALPLAISLTIAIAAAYHYFRRSDPQSSDLVAGSALLTYFAAHGTIILGLMA